MKHFGIEFEFFVKAIETDEIIPAYKVTTNLDGNPILGEIRTGVHTQPANLVFELEKLIYLENERLRKQHSCTISDISMFQCSDEILRNMRKSKSAHAAKEISLLDELSVYGKTTGKLLKRGLIKASLQINISENIEVVHRYVDKDNKDREFKLTRSNLFDVVTPIKMLDKFYEEDIRKAKRVSGVYAFKDGLLGRRLEYRSLPNSINLRTLITTLSQIV